MDTACQQPNRKITFRVGLPSPCTCASARATSASPAARGLSSQPLCCCSGCRPSSGCGSIGRGPSRCSCPTLAARGGLVEPEGPLPPLELLVKPEPPLLRSFVGRTAPPTAEAPMRLRRMMLFFARLARQERWVSLNRVSGSILLHFWQ